MFDAGKTRVIGLPYGEKNCDDMLSRFHLVPERNGQTDRQTDRRTDRFAISISRVSMLTHDNKTANINVKKLRFRHELAATDTSKTAKITKKR